MNRKPRVNLSVQAYIEAATQAHPNRNFDVTGNDRHGYQVWIDKENAGDRMSRLELEAASRAFRAPAPRIPAPSRFPIGSFATIRA